MSMTHSVIRQPFILCFTFCFLSMLSTSSIHLRQNSKKERCSSHPIPNIALSEHIEASNFARKKCLLDIYSFFYTFRSLFIHLPNLFIIIKGFYHASQQVAIIVISYCYIQFWICSTDFFSYSIFICLAKYTHSVSSHSFLLFLNVFFPSKKWFIVVFTSSYMS